MSDKTWNIDERAFEFACEVIELCEKIRTRRGAAHFVASQLLRSGSSVGSNLWEARAGQSRADFVGKARIALKEARESHYWLRILVRTRLGPPPVVTRLAGEANEIVAILTSILKKTTKPSAPKSTPH
ncbi:MAG: four helix bundle protein [Thermoanaerobaculia bacterium]